MEVIVVDAEDVKRCAFCEFVSCLHIVYTNVQVTSYTKRYTIESSRAETDENPESRDTDSTFASRKTMCLRLIGIKLDIIEEIFGDLAPYQKFMHAKKRSD